MLWPETEREQRNIAEKQNKEYNILLTIKLALTLSS